MSRVLPRRWVGKGTEVLLSAVARRCVWCPTPHFLTKEDEILHEAGAPTSDGMCAEAKRRFLEASGMEDDACVG